MCRCECPLTVYEATPALVRHLLSVHGMRDENVAQPWELPAPTLYSVHDTLVVTLSSRLTFVVFISVAFFAFVCATFVVLISVTFVVNVSVCPFLGTSISLSAVRGHWYWKKKGK